MNRSDEVEYRLKLAQGFLAEAEQDIGFQRYRSCVDNAQLSVENAVKVLLAWFGPLPKTHDPVFQLKAIRDTQACPESVREGMHRLICIASRLGWKEHLLTDYGDEEHHVTPWELFDEESARDALKTSQEVLVRIRRILEGLHTERCKEPEQ